MTKTPNTWIGYTPQQVDSPANHKTVWLPIFYPFTKEIRQQQPIKINYNNIYCDVSYVVSLMHSYALGLGVNFVA